MKNLILVILLCATSYGAKAQVASLTINNTTSNTIYVVIKGDPGFCSFSSIYTAAIAPFSAPVFNTWTAFAPPLSWIGGSTINRVDVYASVPGSFCAPTPVLSYSSGCTGSSPSPSTFTIFDASCNPGPFVTATWTPITTLGGGPSATLSF